MMAMRRLGPLHVLVAALISVGLTLTSPPAVQAVPSAPAISAPTTTTLTATWISTGAGSYTAAAYSEATGGSPIKSCTTSALSCQISDLASGTTYWIGVTGASTESVRTSASTVPSSPTALPVSGATATTLTASWSAVTGADSYTATAYSASTGGTAISSCTASSGTTCVITGLANATTYYVSVTATRSALTSAESSRVSGSTVATTPSAPLSVTANGSDAALLVSWSAPASNGGSSITGYTAQAWTAASGGSVVDSCSTSGTNCTITPLTNSTTYYISVFATNSVGDGTASDRLARTPGSLPGAPRSVTTIRGNGTVAISWLAPLSEGSSPVTSYTASVRTSRSSSAPVVGNCSSTDLSCTVSGLTNSTIYYISVTATSNVGEGGPSSFVTASALDAPSAPRNVAATAGNGYATVTWTSPGSTGGSTITQYIVNAYHVAEGGEPIATCEPTPVTSLKCNVGPLPNGGTYFVDVTARNSLLTGPASAPRVSVITGAVSSEPRNVSAVQEGVGVRVKWQAPMADGGRPITRYTATAYASPTSTQSVGTCSTSGDSCIITGVEGYVYVDVVATTAAGRGATSTPRIRVFVTGASDAPRAVSVDQRRNSMTVSWLRPLDDEGVPITIYEATARNISANTSKKCQLFTPVVPKDSDPWEHRFECSLSGLKSGGTYEVTVTAANSVAVVASQPITIRLRQGAPSGPRDVSYLPGDDVIAVGAMIPASRGGSNQTTLRFRAWTKKSGGTIAATCTKKLNKSDTVGLCQLTALKNFEPYWIDAVASNARGSSKVSTRVEVEPSPQVPTAPRNFRVRNREQSFVASWSPSIFDGGFAIRRYIVRVTNQQTGGDVVKTCETKATNFSCEIAGLEPDQHYWFTATAENTVGESQPSEQLDRTS